MSTPVTPGVSVFVTAGTTAPGTAAALPTGSGQQLIVTHFGTVPAWIAWGTDNTVTAVATGAARSYGLLPGTCQTITIGNAAFISYAADAASQDLQFTRAIGE